MGATKLRTATSPWVPGWTTRAVRSYRPPRRPGKALEIEVVGDTEALGVQHYWALPGLPLAEVSGLSLANETILAADDLCRRSNDQDRRIKKPIEMFEYKDTHCNRVGRARQPRYRSLLRGRWC